MIVSARTAMEHGMRKAYLHVAHEMLVRAYGFTRSRRERWALGMLVGEVQEAIDRTNRRMDEIERRK